MSSLQFTEVTSPKNSISVVGTRLQVSDSSPRLCILNAATLSHSNSMASRHKLPADVMQISRFAEETGRTGVAVLGRTTIFLCWYDVNSNNSLPKHNFRCLCCEVCIFVKT